MNITLIGMPGAGKSTIGRYLANETGYTFVDVDSVLEESSGMNVQEIVDTLGDKGFLTLEEATVADLAFVENAVFAPGGSVVYSEKAMATFAEISLIVYLKVSLKTLLDWNIDFSIRGVVGIEKGIEALYKERAPLYEKYAACTYEVSEDFKKEALAEKIISENIDKLS